jgi:glycosyltransferase involved in cell wall biosynthesis
LRVLAIVPAYNEAESVGAVVRELLHRGDLDVLVVNDGSTDDTAAEARAAGARVLDLPLNLGIGGAVQTGYLYARRHCYDVALQVDGDGQHDPTQIDRLLARLSGGEAELALGSRYAEKTSYRSPLLRRAGMIVLSWLVSLVTRQRLRDTTSGFRACTRPLLVYFAENYPQDYPEVEALVLARRAGFRVVEVACRFRERAGGRSTITPLRAAYYMIKVQLAVLIGLFRRVPPLVEKDDEQGSSSREGGCGRE